MDENTQGCDGASVSGYWKGYPCCNKGQHEHEGKMYCTVHLAIAMRNPGRMEAVMEAREKRRKKVD